MKTEKPEATHTVTPQGRTDPFHTLEQHLLSRRNRWNKRVAAALRALERRDPAFHVADLGRRDTFVTIYMQAREAAVRNHQSAKLDALLAIVVNSAVQPDAEEDLQLLFVHFIDIFTSWHLRVMHMLQALLYPKSAASRRLHAMLEHTLEHIFPELAGKYCFFRHILGDLAARQLIRLDDFLITDDIFKDPLKHILGHMELTDLATRFLRFIHLPEGP